MHVGNVVLVLLLVIAAVTCAAGCKTGLCLEPGEVVPDRPFQLTVDLGATEAAIGERVEVTYHLLNASDSAVGACPAGWDAFQVINVATGLNRGRVRVSNDAVALNNVVRLPPHATLSWGAEVVIPDVGVGDADFLGRFGSNCWLWSGTVWSKPVRIHILAGRGQSG
jgi:hypothetical protein